MRPPRGVVSGQRHGISRPPGAGEWNDPANFFIGPDGDGYEHEGLWARLNNERTRFVVIRCEAGITLVCADSIAYVCIAGRTSEVEFRDRVGASRRAAEVRLCTGEELRGEFFSLVPPERSRLSDLLDEERVSVSCSSPVAARPTSSSATRSQQVSPL